VERDARRRWLNQGREEDWQDRIKASRAKRKVIAKAKQKGSRESIHDVADNADENLETSKVES